MTCSKDGCANEGLWHPVIRLRSLDGTASEAIFGQFHLCDDHRASAKLSELLLDGDWVEILRGFAEAGVALPDRAATHLGFISVWDPVTAVYREHVVDVTT